MGRSGRGSGGIRERASFRWQAGFLEFRQRARSISKRFRSILPHVLLSCYPRVTSYPFLSFQTPPRPVYYPDVKLAWARQIDEVKAYKLFSPPLFRFRKNIRKFVSEYLKLFSNYSNSIYIYIYIIASIC